MEEQEDVEILIHIGAPSRTADDTRYRALASAYLAFQPQGQISSPHSHLAPASSPPQAGIVEPLHGPSQDGHDGDYTGLLSGEPVGTLRSPIASFRSVIDNANSPGLRARSTVVRAGPESVPSQATQASWQSPSSVVDDSHPLNHAALGGLSSPTRILENYLQNFASPLQSRARSSSGGAVIISNTPSQPRGQDSSQGDPEATGQLHPSTPSVPSTPLFQGDVLALVSETLKQRADRTEKPLPPSTSGTRDGPTSDEVIEETTIFSSSEPAVNTRADSEPAPSKIPRRPDLESNPRIFLRTASDIGPSTSTKKRVVTIAFLKTHGYKYEDLELIAPAPPVSTANVEAQDLVTPELEKLAQDLRVRERFCPAEVTRELRPLERGYWSLDCSTWEATRKRDAWAYLANYIGSGVAGWGISCRRDAQYRRLRLYCWGEVVPHLYFLLYLASQREILFTGCSWVDGEGHGVINMSRREREN
ncbi:hypothetical protein GGR56DRAFT_207616 [Xylariaceae sp. FL0804]|nr:hypothetical protein GGR56DRAFT_207616 [Xylariaceae sp. FL0804]